VRWLERATGPHWLLKYIGSIEQFEAEVDAGVVDDNYFCRQMLLTLNSRLSHFALDVRFRHPCASCVERSGW